MWLMTIASQTLEHLVWTSLNMQLHDILLMFCVTVVVKQYDNYMQVILVPLLPYYIPYILENLF